MKTQKIGITFSAFDLLHAGHIKMLEEAKTICDYLIVGLQIDPSLDRPQKNKPTQSVVERYIQLKACRSVDEIIPYNTEEDFTGKQYCEDKGIQIYYNKRDHRFSSSALKKAVYEQERDKLNK